MAEKTLQFYESEEITQYYSKYRPTFPPQLWKRIFDFQEKHSVGYNFALDLACGSGQSTFELCNHFHHTIGVDISKAQIACALEKAAVNGKGDNVEFVVAPASKLPVEDESVDLLTCSVAWQWLHPGTFFSEVDRVLKRTGILAVYSYWFPTLCDKRCENLFSDFVNKCTVLQENFYGKDVAVNHYRDIRLPYPVAERHEMVHRSTLSLEEFAGYMKSFDEYATYCEQNPGTTALENLVKEMRKILTEESNTPDAAEGNDQLSDVTIDVEMPYFLLLAVKQ